MPPRNVLRIFVTKRAKLLDMLLEVLVIVLIENIVVPVFPIKLDRIVDITDVYSRLGFLLTLR